MILFTPAGAHEILKQIDPASQVFRCGGIVCLRTGGILIHPDGMVVHRLQDLVPQRDGSGRQTAGAAERRGRAERALRAGGCPSWHPILFIQGQDRAQRAAPADVPRAGPGLRGDAAAAGG